MFSLVRWKKYVHISVKAINQIELKISVYQQKLPLRASLKLVSHCRTTTALTTTPSGGGAV